MSDTENVEVVATYMIVTTDVLRPNDGAETFERGVEYAKSQARVDEILHELAQGKRDYASSLSITVINSQNLGPQAEVSGSGESESEVSDAHS